jgi:hypothetical protein
VSEVVQAQSSGYDDEPGRELGALIGDVGPKTAEVVAAELLQQVGIRVHRGVIVAAQCSSRVQQQAAMRLEKRLPSHLASRGIGGLEETGQLLGEQGDLPPPSGEALT